MTRRAGSGWRQAALWLGAAALCLGPATTAFARDYYVSAKRGKGKKGTKKKPAKDLGNLIKRLKPGDVIHIAGGTYVGRAKNGSDLIKVPVQIFGGYDEAFETRDPWGKTPTILSGVNKSKNWVSHPGLFIDLSKYRDKPMPEIVVDGIVVDHADRNRYKTAKQHKIVRTANPKKQQMPTPESGGIVIRVSKTGNFAKDAHWKIAVRNCIVMNTAPTQGALSVSGYKNSEITIENNLVINNTGVGIFIGTKYVGRDGKGQPRFNIHHNTVLFSWKHDPMAQSFSGSSIKFDRATLPVVRDNILAFADRVGIDNASKAPVLLAHNLVTGNTGTDYLEFATSIDLENIEDEAEELHEDSEDNVNQEIKPPVSKAWSQLYASRIIVDRNAAEADVKVKKTRINALRRMLGLPLEGGKLDVDTGPVWLPRLSLEDALKCANTPVAEGFGCGKPK